MASRKELLDSIHEGMKLDKSFFLKVYGYEITSRGFADKAIKILEDCGCSKAREYYNTTVEEYQEKRRKELKEVACYISQKWEEEWEKLTEQEEGENRNKNGDWHGFKGFPSIQ